MRLLIKLIYILILSSCFYANYSYYSLILPRSSSHLLSNDAHYNFKINLLFNNFETNHLTASFIQLPNNINIGLFEYQNNNVSFGWSWRTAR